MLKKIKKVAVLVAVALGVAGGAYYLNSGVGCGDHCPCGCAATGVCTCE